MPPLNTLLKLTHQIAHLDEVQEWIDHARNAAPTNRIVQSNLDRHQRTVDLNRAKIELMMLEISTLN